MLRDSSWDTGSLVDIWLPISLSSELYGGCLTERIAVEMQAKGTTDWKGSRRRIGLAMTTPAGDSSYDLRRVHEYSTCVLWRKQPREECIKHLPLPGLSGMVARIASKPSRMRNACLAYTVRTPEWPLPHPSSQTRTRLYGWRAPLARKTVVLDGPSTICWAWYSSFGADLRRSQVDLTYGTWLAPNLASASFMTRDLSGEKYMWSERPSPARRYVFWPSLQRIPYSEST